MLGFGVTKYGPSETVGPSNHCWSNLLIGFAMFWSYVSALSNILPLILIPLLWHKNTEVYQSLPVVRIIFHYGGNNLAEYGGSLTDGYVSNSTIPKQLCGYIALCFFYLTLLAMFGICLAADVSWYFTWANNHLAMYHVFCMQGSMDSLETMHVVCVALFKTFTACALGSQSFATFGDGNGRPQQISSYKTWQKRDIYSWYLWLYILNAFVNMVLQSAIYWRMKMTKDRKKMLIVDLDYPSEKV